MSAHFITRVYFQPKCCEYENAVARSNTLIDFLTSAVEIQAIYNAHLRVCARMSVCAPVRNAIIHECAGVFYVMHKTSFEMTPACVSLSISRRKRFPNLSLSGLQNFQQNCV